MEESLVDMFSQAPYLVSFLAGMLTFLSPCVLPLIPAYLSYISGISVSQLKDSEKMTFAQRLKVIKASLMFIAGFSLVFILLGASMARLIGDIFSYSWVSYIAGAIIIIFGLHVMHVISIPFLNYEARADFGDADKKVAEGFWKKLLQMFAPFLLGVSFALGWTPCIGPIFAGIISMAAQESAKGVTLMTVYAIGLGIPFLLTAILTSSAMNLINKIKKHFNIVEYVAGGLLVLIGVAVATGGLGKISAWFVDILG